LRHFSREIASQNLRKCANSHRNFWLETTNYSSPEYEKKTKETVSDRETGILFDNSPENDDFLDKMGDFDPKNADFDSKNGDFDRKRREIDSEGRKNDKKMRICGDGCEIG
jgi:hypothetical protein